MTATLRIVLTGASGYLGQHLLCHWLEQGPPNGYNYEITAFYHTSQGFPQAAIKEFQAKAAGSDTISLTVRSCDLTASESLEVPQSIDVCIHAAAMSSPRVCEKDPNKAEAINVPKAFFEKLPKSCTIIAFSTDQVYDGRKNTQKDGHYTEGDDDPNPLNTYAKTKLALEEYLKKRNADGSGHTILLRSSIILGAKARLSNDVHETFLHFCSTREGKETTFYTNEYRTVVNVGHVCKVTDWMISNLKKLPKYDVYNLGGPNRVNRIDMAQAVFEHFGYDKKYILPIEQKAETVPLDISMNNQKLQEFTGIVHEPATLKEMVELTFPKPI